MGGCRENRKGIKWPIYTQFNTDFTERLTEETAQFTGEK